MQKRVQYLKNGLPLSAVLLCFVLPFSVFAQTDTAKKLKEVNIKGKPVPQVQTVTPQQQINVTDLNQQNAVNVADAVRDFPASISRITVVSAG